MAFSLIQEDVFYKEETTYSDPYTLRGVYHDGEETTTYKIFTGTDEPYDEESILVLPAGTSPRDARTLYSSEPLLTYDDTNDTTLADVVYLTDPEVGKYKPKRYIVMDKEHWKTNASFSLLQGEEATSYLLIKEEKVID